MLTVLYYLAAFVVTVLLVVVVHELGHYWAARKCGVSVLKFSFGFGRKLWSWRSRNGVEWAVSAIPLGGYVRMLDRRAGDVTAERSPGVDFMDAPPPARLCIALAGPAANLVLAAACIFCVLSVYERVPMPVVGGVAPESPADRAGLRPHQVITSVDGQRAFGWWDVVMALAVRMGETGAVRLDVQTPGKPMETVHIPIHDFLANGERGAMGTLGVAMETPAILGFVPPGSPAEAAGLRPWDRVSHVNGDPVETWRDLAKAVQAARAGEPMVWRIVREDQEGAAHVTPPAAAGVDVDGTAAVGIEPPSVGVRSRGWAALTGAVRETVRFTVLVSDHILKIATGRLSSRSVGGPISVAKASGRAFGLGWRTYLRTLALLSVAIAVINLLPIPLLDGGVALQAIVEWVRGAPLPDGAVRAGQAIGMLAIGLVMTLAIFNDLLRMLDSLAAP